MKKDRKEMVKRVTAEGVAAFKAGKGRLDNPYIAVRWRTDCHNHLHWQRGYDDAAWEAQCRVDASYERMNALRGCEGKENA